MIVRFFAHLREITGVKETLLSCHDNAIKDVLDDLSQLFGESFKKILFNDKGDLYVRILINGRNIDYLDGLNSMVTGDEIVVIFPPVAGG